ncbi:N-acylneuraminate-9-phosphatase [Phlebotomus argentipes]|uniref:N-acylneuraminate-9-phosphatase n=1 Tax=Phlebotomus argentipes TaxID=94469 RepID=UPI0028937BA1|nr:N-acylneuraminate-9-phosphatase [Phlebotomus argentipes]
MATQKMRNVGSLSQVTTIFFDLDNTLIPTRKADAKACNKLVDFLQEEHAMSREAALVATSTFLRAFRRCPDNEELPLDEWRTQLWADALPEPFKCLSGGVYRTWLQLRLRYMEPTAETVKLLESLRANFLLALITNGPSAAQWEKVNRLNVAKYFDCILVSGDLPWEKPDARIYHAACNLLGVQAQQCIMIGDKLETDIQGGKQAKLGATLWIPLTSAERAEPELGLMPDFTIHNLSDMLAVLPCGQPCGRYAASRSRCSSIGTSAAAAARRSRVPYNRRVASLPDLDNCNSNSSDGS